jgi:hypothetical protein
MAWTKYTPDDLEQLASELELRAKSLRDAAAIVRQRSENGGGAFVEMNQSLSKSSPLTKGFAAIMDFAAQATAKAGMAQVRCIGKSE